MQSAAKQRIRIKLADKGPFLKWVAKKQAN
jgi:hypothetical protein